MDEQPMPTSNDSTPIQILVLRDLSAIPVRNRYRSLRLRVTERARVGRERYGTLLQANNGRDMWRDAMDEALDLIVYLRGAMEEVEPESADRHRLMRLYQRARLLASDMIRHEETHESEQS